MKIKTFNLKIHKKFLTIFLLIIVSFPFLLGAGNLETSASVKGIDISGLNTSKASAFAQEKVLTLKSQINIKLVFEEKEFALVGSELNVKDVKSVVKQTQEEILGNTIFDKINVIKKRNKKVVVPYINFFDGIEDKISFVKTQVEREMLEPEVSFNPSAKNMFTATNGVIGVKVNTEEFWQRLKNNFDNGAQGVVSVPVKLTPPTKSAKEVLSLIKKRSEFSTNYSSSVGGRRHNVLLSLSAFNGLVVKPGEKVSFNKVLEKIPASKFQLAKIIVNGEFVDGRGGGMCQASTTLYNALLLADLHVLESYSHSLPVGYVKFGFDAMVSPPNADLVFQNSTTSPIYIKTHGNNDDCFVEIFGEEMPKGLVIKRRSENIRTLKHSGDKIIPDTTGKYSDKILFKGEFHRVKYPQDGYEAKSYLQYFLDGELVEEKYLRFSRYNAQQGIVYEGTEELLENFDNNLVATSAYHAEGESAQTQNETAEEIENKIKAVNPAHYNP